MAGRRARAVTGGPLAEVVEMEFAQIMGDQSWADFREDKKINPAPDLGPPVPTAGSGSLGNGSGLRNSAGYTPNQPRSMAHSWVLCVVGVGSNKIKYK